MLNLENKTVTGKTKKCILALKKDSNFPKIGNEGESETSLPHLYC